MAHIQTIRLKPVIQQGDGLHAAADWRQRDGTVMTNTCAQCWKYNPPDAYVSEVSNKNTRKQKCGVWDQGGSCGTTDVCSSLNVLFEFIKLGWTTATAPLPQQVDNLTSKMKVFLWRAHGGCRRIHTAPQSNSEALQFSQLFANDPKADLLRAHVSVRCTGYTGGGVEVIRYGDDVSSSIEEKVRHNYQPAISLWLFLFGCLFVF